MVVHGDSEDGWILHWWCRAEGLFGCCVNDLVNQFERRLRDELGATLPYSGGLGTFEPTTRLGDLYAGATGCS